MLDAALVEGAGDQADDVVVAAGEDRVERLEDRHLGAEVGQERGELAPDHPAADDGDRGRELLEVEELVRGHDPAPVDLEAGQAGGHRPGRQDDVAAHHDAAGILTVEHLDAAVGLEGARARQGDHLAPLEQSRQALEQLVHHGVLAVLADREVERHRGDADAELLGALDRAVHRGRLEELLGRDAAAVQAGPADLVPLDDGDGQPRGGAVERGGVAARSAADHDDVELFFGGHRPSSSCPHEARPARSAPPRRPDRTGRTPLRVPRVFPRHSTVRTTALRSAAAAVSPVRVSRSRRAPSRPPRWRARRPGRSSGRPSDPSPSAS